MASEFDASEFVDNDFQSGRKSSASPAAAGLADNSQRAPTREEVESKVGEMQQKLAELKRAQQELERERNVLEETRRRQLEFTTGRQEMVQHLTRGVGLLEESEFALRRDAEQMAKTLLNLREALIKIQSIHEEGWSRESLGVELTRASTIVENARMEWNAARLKFPLLSGAAPAEPAAPAGGESNLESFLRQQSYFELCKMGLALTWPLALTALAIFVVLLFR